MPRNYPLTWLFIIATVCVDMAVLFTTDWGSAMLEDAGPRFYLYNFGLPAQFSTLAIWGVLGRSHRLVRAAWITLAFGSLMSMTWLVEGPISGESFALSFIQFFTVSMGTALWRAVGIGGRTVNEPIRISLVEMFGWTMVVALWAFAVRFALGGALVDAYTVVWIFAASVAPILVVPVLYAGLSTARRLFWLSTLYVIAMLAYVVLSNFMDGPMPLWALGMAIAQLIYISAWWSVVRMDEALEERRALAEHAREKLRVFETGDESKT